MSYTAKRLESAAHREQLLGLWSDSMSEARIAAVAPQRYRWLYERNPEGTTRTVVSIHVETNEVIGCASYIPRSVVVDGRVAASGVLCDFAVHPKHRTAGPAISVQRTLAGGSFADGAEFLYGYPAEASLAIFKRLRWILVGEVGVWIRPIRSEYKVSERIANPLLAKVGGAAVDTALRASALRRILWRPRWYRTEILERADSRFDDLWSRLQCSYVTGAKGSAFLNWRYAEYPTASYQFFTLVCKKQLIGFVVYTVKDGVVAIGDLYCDLDNDLDLLLFAFAEKMRRLGNRSIYASVAGPGSLGRALEAHHFFPRPHKRQLLAYVNKKAPAELRERLSKLESWYLFDGELDI